MNFALMEQIIRHIYNNLGVVSTEMAYNFNEPIRSDKFLLPDKLNFEDDDGKVINNSVWGCQITAEQKTMKILVAECTQDPRIPEFAALVQLQGAPAYGLYLVYNDLVPECLPDPLIAASTDNKNWMVCETILQATFLAGMEQIKDLGMGWSKCSSYKEQLSLLHYFIRFHGLFYGEL